LNPLFSNPSDASGIMCIRATAMKIPQPNRTKNEMAVWLSIFDSWLGIKIERPATYVIATAKI